MKKKVLYIIPALVFILLFSSCKKSDDNALNNSAIIIPSANENEEIDFCEEIENASLLAFVTATNPGTRRLEVWNITQSGKVLSKIFIDSGTSASFIGLSKMDDNGYAFFSYVNNEIFLYRLGTDAKILWKKGIKNKNFEPLHLQWIKNSIVLSGLNTAVNPYNTLFLRYDITGNLSDSVLMQQFVKPAGFPGNINNSMQGAVAMDNRYAYEVLFEKTTGQYAKDNIGICMADATGKLTHAYFVQQRLNFYGGFAPTKDGGTLYFSNSAGNAPIEFTNQKTVIFKFNSSCDSVWCKTYGETESNIWGGDQAVGGGYYIYGSCGNVAHGSIQQAYIAKIDEDGNKVWEHKMEGWLNSYIINVSQMKDGSICCTGTTTIAGGRKTGSDGFLIFLKPDGSFK